MNRFYRAVLVVISIFTVFTLFQGCGSGSSSKGTCCQSVKLSDKIKETDKVATVPEVKGDQIVYVDRNITVIEYVDRNVTIIKYIDRNVTVEVIKVRPEAEITGLKDGAILDGTTLRIDGLQSSDEDGNVTTYQWMLDDVNISTEKNPTIDLPTKPGSHKLCLIVKDNDNLTSKTTCKSFVIPAPDVNPTAAITGLNDNVVKTKCPVSVSGANSIGKDADIVSYSWVIDKNITLNGKDQNLSFDTLGEHEVCLSVIDTNDLNDTVCNIVDVQDHVSPTPLLTVTDRFSGEIVRPKDINLTRGGTYDLSCKGSHDDCNSSVPVTCEWNAHSYRIVNNEKVDYISDCFSHNNSPKIGEKSWIQLCGSPISDFRYVEIELKITDQFGKSSTRTDIFEVAP